MADRLILCSECGTKNRVGGDRTGKPTCGNCGKALAVPGYSGAGKSQLFRPAFWFALGIASVVGVLYYNDPSIVQKLNFFGPGDNKPTYLETLPEGFVLDSPPASNEQTNAQAPDLSKYGRSVEELPDTSKLTPSKILPVRISTGIIKWPQSAIAPLEIKTTTGFNYFIKLIDSNGRSAMTMYIKGGENFQTKVPLGTFEVRYATGTNMVWRRTSVWK